MAKRRDAEPIQSPATSPLDLVRLTPLMERTSGSPEIVVAMIDGPIVIGHPALPSERIREIPGALRGTCSRASSTACMHGTFVAGVLSASRGSAAPAICPGCTLLVRPIFSETTAKDGQIPTATPEELATAIIDTVEAGARVINLSAALAHPSAMSERAVEEALDYAARRDVIAVAAAGNQGTLGATAIVRHPWVIPVTGCDRRGNPLAYANLGSSIGRRGLSAPGYEITSLGSDGKPVQFGGTSAATPFVTGAIALIWADFPEANAAEVRFAVTDSQARRRSTVVPPLLDAWAAHALMARAGARGRERRRRVE